MSHLEVGKEMSYRRGSEAQIKETDHLDGDDDDSVHS